MKYRFFAVCFFASIFSFLISARSFAGQDGDFEFTAFEPATRKTYGAAIDPAGLRGDLGGVQVKFGGMVLACAGLISLVAMNEAHSSPELRETIGILGIGGWWIFRSGVYNRARLFFEKNGWVRIPSKLAQSMTELLQSGDTAISLMLAGGRKKPEKIVMLMRTRALHEAQPAEVERWAVLRNRLVRWEDLNPLQRKLFSGTGNDSAN